VNCVIVQEALVDQILGEGADADRAWVAHHVRECPACARESERIRRTIGLLRGHTSDAGAVLEPARRDALVRAARRREPWWSYAAMAASLVVLVSGVLYQVQRSVGPAAPPGSVVSPSPTPEPGTPPPPLASTDAHDLETQRQIDALRAEVERLKADRVALPEAPRATTAPPLDGKPPSASELLADEARGRQVPPAPTSISAGTTPALAPRGGGPAAASGGTPAPRSAVPLLSIVRRAEKVFVDTVDDRPSTFALDVDTASYPVARTYGLHDLVPPQSAQRIDEFARSVTPVYAAASGGTAFTVHVDGAPSPFRAGYHILRVAVKAHAPERSQPRVVTFVVDVSPHQPRFGLVEHVIEMLLMELDPQDRIAIVRGGARPHVVLEPTTVQHRDPIAAALRNLRASSSVAVDVLPALELGYAVAKAASEARAASHVVLFTDTGGGRWATDVHALVALSKTAADQGIDLVALDVPSSENRPSMLRKAAEEGAIPYMRLEGLGEADARHLATELPAIFGGVVAREAKARLELDPAAVERYRLLGCEKRTAADRLLWRKEGGAIYDGHVLAAWYEVKLTSGGGDLGRALIRYTGKDGRRAEERLRLPEDGLAPTFRESRDEFQLAAVVAHLTEGVRERDWAKEASLAGMLQEADALPPDIRRVQAVEAWVRLLRSHVEQAARAGPPGAATEAAGGSFRRR
jgi:Ca-activated chloride channel homolog